VLRAQLLSRKLSTDGLIILLWILIAFLLNLIFYCNDYEIGLLCYQLCYLLFLWTTMIDTGFTINIYV
jgi:hypothetical protein